MKAPQKANLFDLSGCQTASDELFDVLAHGKKVRIERIVSRGHTTPAGKWYDQDQDEWVALLQGEATLQWENGEETKMVAGDWVLIPRHRPHRVIATSVNPHCVWLAVHADLG